MTKAKHFPSAALLVLSITCVLAVPAVFPATGLTARAGRISVRAIADSGSGSTDKSGPDKDGSSSNDASRKAQPQAFTLVSLRHETVGRLTRIMVESSAPPQYTVSRPSDRLIVIELPGGDGSKLAREYQVGTPSVGSIWVRGASSEASTRPNSPTASATRIEIEVKTGIKDRSSLNGNTLVLELSPDQQAGNDERPTAVPGDARVQTVRDSASRPTPTDAASGDQKAGVYVYPVSVKANSKVEARTADQTTLKSATVLRGLRTEPAGRGLRIVLDADGRIDFKDFALAGPDRIVVDVIGVRSEIETKTMAVDQAGIDRIRIGQPNSGVVRIVLDSKQKVAYRIQRERQSLLIDIGQVPAPAQSFAAPGQEPQQPEQPHKTPQAGSETHASVTPSATQKNNTGQAPKADSQHEAIKAVSGTGAQPQPQKGAPQARQSQDVAPHAGAQAPAKATAHDSSSDAQAATPPANASRSSAQSGPKPDLLAVASNQTNPRPGAVSTIPASVTQPVEPARDKQQMSRRRGEPVMCDADYVGGPISFDLRAVDIREMLRFIYQNYGVNFIVDKSVTQVPVDITITGVPWNQVMNAVLRANRLGWVCEDQGRIVRIATLEAIKDEESQRQALAAEKDKGIPLKTVIRHLKYARASGSIAGTGSGSTGGGGTSGGGGGAGGGGGRGAQGSLLTIITGRNSARGKTEVDSRTNSLIITDIPDRIDAILSILDLLDKPEAQVEIEARIVVADRNFLRDLGVQLAAGVSNSKSGGAAVLETGSVVFTPGSLGSSTSGGGSSSGGASLTNQIASNIPFTPAQNALQATANTVLGLTSGRIGTSILSAALSASETKGQIRTISTPRITAQDNMTAEIINGVQIPVQTVTNNTVTTTFVTAALRLEITPQIVEETGEVTMHIVAENNTVNTALANQFNGGTPGINTQSAESIMRVKDGGTAVMGGINIDNESTTENRTPGLASVPLLGNLFKRKTVSRDNSEILFFVTPRIVHREAPDLPAGTGGAQSSLVPNTPAGDKVNDASPKQGSVVASAGSPSASK
ncbi:MAG TPA: type IV pilus secretin PilQ [Blastocatellia bacterium]